MVKFVLDADGAIKLAKAGVLEALAERASCLLPEQVYSEVMRGKEKMYEDAFVTESLVEKLKIKVIQVSNLENLESSGAGEISALAAFRREAADAIITDDTHFISIIERRNIPFMTPTDTVVWLVKIGKISMKEGFAALDRIRSIVRKGAYARAKGLIGGEIK